jgi:ATP-dependent Clp protease ATP-binding subunit ClpA
VFSCRFIGYAAAAPEYLDFTEQAARVLPQAWDVALQNRQSLIGPYHILMGLLTQESTDAVQILRQQNVPIEQVTAELDLRIRSLPRPTPAIREIRLLGILVGTERAGKYRLTFRAQLAYHLAFLEAVQLQHHHVSTGHILIGLLQEGMSPASQMLFHLGVNAAKMRSALRESSVEL